MLEAVGVLAQARGAAASDEPDSLTVLYRGGGRCHLLRVSAARGCAQRLQIVGMVRGAVSVYTIVEQGVGPVLIGRCSAMVALQWM